LAILQTKTYQQIKLQSNLIIIIYLYF